MSDWPVKFEAAGQPCAPKTVATMSLCPLRDGDHRRRLLTMANRWGREDTVEVSASEERWISHVNATTCAQIDQTRISRDLTLGAEAHVLDPQTVYEVRLLPLLMHEAFAGYAVGAQARGTDARLTPAADAGWAGLQPRLHAPGVDLRLVVASFYEAFACYLSPFPLLKLKKTPQRHNSHE
jgi:hypothetical protein